MTWAERVFDVTLTLLAAPVIALIGAALALAIYIDSPGPVIYRSRRIGRDGVEFQMLKFRKMLRDAHASPLTLDRDDRFTPIGRFLALTRLDELPQFINVLRGEMRLVGPRPEVAYFVEEYAEEYAEILTVTPGITGNAQLRFLDERLLLSGPAPAETYTDHVLPAKIEIDLDYVRRHTLAGDAAILARTVLVPWLVLGRALRGWLAASRRWLPPLTAAGLIAAVFILLSNQLP